MRDPCSFCNNFNQDDYCCELDRTPELLEESEEDERVIYCMYRVDREESNELICII